MLLVSTSLYIPDHQNLSMDAKSSSFLADTANDICHRLQGDFSHCLVLLPTSLGAEVFQHCVVQTTNTSHALLQVNHIDAWVVQQSGLQEPNTLKLLTVLYTCWRQLKEDWDESFEQFYGFGSILLQDFDVIDRYLVHADQLFRNLYEQKKFQITFDQLSPEEQQAILSFWDTFKTNLSAHQQDFLTFWRLLAELYTSFTATLLRQHQGYIGLCYKWVCEHLKPCLLEGVKQVIVIGFNDLPPATDKLFAWMDAHAPTWFYWDLDAAYMQNDRQEAGHKLRSHQRKAYLKASFREPYPANIYNIPKKITLCECHTSISQVQRIAEALQPVWQDAAAVPPRQIGIILADETLLVSLLQALPIPYASIYATKGYPLIHTMAYQLMTRLMAFQLTLQQSSFAAQIFPTSSVIQVLTHPLIQAFDPEGAQQTVAMLQKDYPNSVPAHLLAAISSVYQTIFQPTLSGKQLLHYLVAVLDTLLAHTREGIADTGNTLAEQTMLLLKDKLEALQQHPEVVTGLSIDEVKRLFHAFTHGVEVPFTSAPHTAAVYIVDISATMNLDFKQVYILGMNEGCWPTKNSTASFIPYNLRRGYGLPTQSTSQASIEAYYFYRLLHRAEQVYITYSNVTSGGQKSEKSRYIWQLLYESQLPVEQEFPSSTVVNAAINPIIIHKDASIMAALDNYLAQEGAPAARIFTPAALNTYIDCSLLFYFKYIVKLPNAASALDDKATEAIQFGTILHKVVEQLYQPLLGKQAQVVIQQADLIALTAQVEQVLTHTLDTYVYPGCAQEGWVIEQAVIERVIHKLLEWDAAYLPFELWGMEVGHNGSLVTPFRLRNGKTMLLGGVIDRVDHREGIIRVIDYKTGNDKTSAASMEGLFAQSSTRNKAFLQVLFYAWLIKRQPKYAAKAVLPLLLNIKDIFQPSFDPRLRFTKNTAGPKPNSSEDVYINDITSYIPQWEGCLDEVLTALFDSEIPFVQTEQLYICSACPYNRICQRM